MVCYDNDVLQCAARRQNPGPRRGTQGHTAQYSKYSTARCRCRRYPRTWATYRLIRDLLEARPSLWRLAPKRVRPVRCLHHGCVVVRGRGDLSVLQRDGEQSGLGKLM